MADDSKFGKNGWKIRMVSILTGVVIVAVFAGVIKVGYSIAMPKYESYQAEKAKKEKEEAAARKELEKQEAAARTEAEQETQVTESNSESGSENAEAENIDVVGNAQTEVQEEAQTEPQAEETAQQDYIIPDSDSRYLSEADVQGMTIQQINYAKNEIYARHGRIFASQELKNYFESKSWYQGTIDGAAFDRDYKQYFNQYEIVNAEFLSKTEFSMEDGGYKLDQ